MKNIFKKTFLRISDINLEFNNLRLYITIDISENFSLRFRFLSDYIYIITVYFFKFCVSQLIVNKNFIIEKLI